MRTRFGLLFGTIGIVLAGCVFNPLPPTGNNGDSTTGDSSTDDNTGGSENGGALSIGGTLAGNTNGKNRPKSQVVIARQMIVVQSAETGAVYTAFTDGEGNFQINLPESEAGNAFIVTIVDSSGKAAGPVVFGESNGQGLTGLEVSGNADLGTINLPENPGQAPISPGDDGNVGAGDVATDIVTRLNGFGVPVGVPTFGKGSEAGGGESANPRQQLDIDADGLIDLFDADNNGNGIIDDFDPSASMGGFGEGGETGTHVNFFMNLKIPQDRAAIYASGNPAEIDAALGTDTVITLDIPQPQSGPRITAVRVLDSPAPSYLASATVMGEHGAGSGGFPLWSDSGYAFTDRGDRFDAFVIPNALIEAGDTFTVELTFDDGSTEQTSRMINYVFTNIPQLIQVGAPGSLADYASGTITFDGTQDVVLVFQPPVDESGEYITQLDYYFEFFYNEAGTHAQINDIDADATWPGGTPAGFDAQNHNFVVSAADLTLGSDNTYTVTLPKELFVDVVTVQGGGTKTVGEYHIDIAAQNNGNNAAFMVHYQKQ